MTATARESKRIQDHRKALGDGRRVLKLFGKKLDKVGRIIGHYFTVASESRPGNAHLVTAHVVGPRQYRFECSPMCQRFHWERTCMHCVLVERWFIAAGALEDPLLESDEHND